MEKSSHNLHSNDQTLAKFKIFAGLSQDELRTIVEQSTAHVFPAGHRIVATGEPGYCMYIILRGSVRISVQRGNDVVPLATLQPGDFFGEVALVDEGPRSADGDALEECELLCVTRTTLGVLAGLQPGAAVHLLAAIGRCLVQRLRAGNEKFMDLTLLGRQSSEP